METNCIFGSDSVHFLNLRLRKPEDPPDIEKRERRPGRGGASHNLTSLDNTEYNTSAYRLQRRVEHLHHVGARALHEFLLELITAHGIADDVEGRLADFARIDLGILRALGGDRFPPRPLHLLDVEAQQ